MRITKDKEIAVPLGLRISTTLVANNFPHCETQTSVVMALSLDGNIVGFNFRHNVIHAEDKSVGWCHIQCLNAAVYIERIHKSTYMFKRHIDFILRKGSIDGTVPNKNLLHLAQALVREVVVQQMEAINNANIGVGLTEKHFLKSMQEWEQKNCGNFVQFATPMNHNTNTRVDVAIDTLVKQAANIYEILGHMASEFLVSQQRMQVMTQNLAFASHEAVAFGVTGQWAHISIWLVGPFLQSPNT